MPKFGKFPKIGKSWQISAKKTLKNRLFPPKKLGKTISPRAFIRPKHKRSRSIETRSSRILNPPTSHFSADFQTIDLKWRVRFIIDHRNYGPRRVKSSNRSPGDAAKES